MAWITDFVELYRKDKNLVDVFGLVLFTNEHANIKKVINDEDYWSSFNELSGKRWAIFSARQQTGSYGFPPSRPDVMQFMVQVWREPEANKELLNYLELESTKELPLFAVFSEYEDNILSTFLKINDESINNAYGSLKAAIRVTTESIENISEENIKLKDGAFAVVALAVSDYKQLQLLKKGVNLVHWLKGLIP